MSAGIPNPAEWIAVDWGTSRLRVWAMSLLGDVLASESSDQGAGSLKPEEFEAALIALIGPWLDANTCTPVLVCGMAGSRQGWAEAPYVSLPADLADVACGAVSVKTADRRISVSILPGVCQRDASSPDVIRGEETQLLGLVNALPAFSGCVCLPGTHSKWVQLNGNRVMSSRTYMTGELFKLLGTRSILRHSIDGAAMWDEAGFVDGVRRAVSRNGVITSDIFAIRAHGLLFGPNPDRASAYLSGLIIGGEIVSETRPDPTGKTIIIGARKLAQHYQTAFEIIGMEAEQVDAGDLTLLGLSSAREMIGKTGQTIKDAVL